MARNTTSVSIARIERCAHDALIATEFAPKLLPAHFLVYGGASLYISHSIAAAICLALFGQKTAIVALRLLFIIGLMVLWVVKFDWVMSICDFVWRTARPHIIRVLGRAAMFVLRCRRAARSR